MSKAFLDMIAERDGDILEFKISYSNEMIVPLTAFNDTKGTAIYVGFSDKGEVKWINLGRETV